MSGAILVIDDEAGLRRSLCAHLEDLDYEVVDAANGREGLDALMAAPGGIRAVFVDLNMPVMDGYTFIRHAVLHDPELPIIVLSGVGVVEDALKAMRLGAWDFITKPVQSMSILDYTLDKVMERARLLHENRQYKESLEEQVRRRTRQLEDARRQIMLRLSRAAEYKDNETGRHVVRVGEISAMLSQAMGLSEEFAEMMRECATLHDLGKIGIPDAILLKPGKLTPDEWEVMKQHCVMGCAILGPLEGTEDARQLCTVLPQEADDAMECHLIRLARSLALLHHEKWDGSGYPFGLSGEDIPIGARIVALVDVFDALVSERPYKKAFPLEQSLAIIRESSGSHFDPAVVEAFFGNLDAIRDVMEKWRD